MALETEKKDLAAISARTAALWSVTTWFWGLLFSGVGITIYLDDKDNVEGAFTWLGLALLAYFLAGVGFAVATVIGDSRKQQLDADDKPVSSNKALLIFQGLQGAGLVLTAVFLAGALYTAINARGDDPLNESLAGRVETFLDERDDNGDAASTDKVNTFCKEHSDDDEATKVLGETCTAFGVGTPTRQVAEGLIKRLRGED